MLHRLCPAAAALVLLALPAMARADEPPPDAPAAAPATQPARRGFGEPGDIILHDVIGARTSRAPTAGFVGGVGGVGGIGGVGGVGGVGSLGALGGFSPGPSLSAAWFDIASTKTRFGPFPSSELTTVRFEPSVDVFVARHVSIGGAIGFETSRMRFPAGLGAPPGNVTAQWTALSFDPRLGYAIPLTEAISLWPRVSAGITVQQQTFGAAPRSYRVGGGLPLVVRVSSHVLLDVGPELTYAVLDVPPGFVSRSFHVAGRGGLSLAF
jgi:hypothetical protein